MNQITIIENDVGGLEFLCACECPEYDIIIRGNLPSVAIVTINKVITLYYCLLYDIIP